ncbi:MAG TPA: DUF5615 family PIN-like protein [Stellaceae bacterium]|nr:DUF5615 family PIN-like protein [Stellaceae bacterium]
MRLKLDENLSRGVAELCRAAGHDVMTVRGRVRIHLAKGQE